MTGLRAKSMALFLLVAALAFGQTSTSQISGTVTDSSGAVIPNATVTATNEATGVKYTQVTTGAGVYAFPSLPVGAYTVTVEMAGFKKYSRTGNTILVNTPLTVDIALEVGGAAETVQVEASAQQLQTNNAVIGNVVERKAIVDLPLNGRNPLTLLSYEPGVVQRSGNTINVNGARAAATNVTIDGIEANESTNPNPTNNLFRLNPDNVQEFKVTTQNPSAEEGRNSGANVAIATRSGTNEFHGTTYYFNRNTAFNSNEFYSNAQGLPRPQLKLHQWGFEAGGPIIKNKTFVFGSWQGQRVAFSDPVDKAFGEPVNVFAPTVLNNGIFRYAQIDPNVPWMIGNQRITQNGPLLIDQRTGALAPGVRACSGPTDVNCVGSYNIFANDPRGIGADRTIQRLFQGYPGPNSYQAGDGLNEGAYVWNSPTQVRGPHWMVRVDHTINEKHSVFFRWLQAEQNTLGGDPLNGRPQIFPGFPPRGEVFRPGKNAALGVRSTLTPRLINELTLGYSRFTFLFSQGEANPNFPNTPPWVFDFVDRDYINTPRTFRAVNTPQIINNMTFVKGAHVFRWGFNARFYQHNDQRGDLGGATLTPSVNFSRTTRPPVGFNTPVVSAAGRPGIVAADNNRLLSYINILTGTPAQITQNFVGDLTSDSFLPYRSGDAVTLWYASTRANQYNLFIQDEWKIRRDLTLSYGVRWELNPAPTEKYGRVYTPDKDIRGTEGMVRFQQSDRWFGRNNMNLFAPRFGLAWQPFGSQKTVIRAGYGVAYDTVSTFQVTAAANSVPGLRGSCSSTVGGATTPGCTPAPNVRISEGFPSQLPPPSFRPSQFLSPPLQTRNNAPNVTVFTDDLKIPTTHMWNFTVQREAPLGFVLSAGYVGRRGTRLFFTRDVNQITANAAVLESFGVMQRNVATAGCRPDGTTAAGAVCGTPVPLVQRGVLTSAFVNGAQTVTDLNQNAAGNFAGRADDINVATSQALGVRPNLQFNRITFIDNAGDSYYHAAQFTFRRRFDQAGLLLTGAYTLGKSIDNQSLDPVGAASGGGLGQTATRTPVDSYNLPLERARSDFDQRHVLNISGIYELPFGKTKPIGKDAPGWLNAIIGGWSLNGIYTYQSGEPFTVRSGALTHNFSAQSRAALTGELPQTQMQEIPGVTGPVFFRDASGFRFPGPGQVGIGRNLFQGPSFWNLDASIAKSVNFTEKVRLIIRAEAFNALNHPNFRNPRDASVGSPAITSSVFGQACCVTLSTASSATTNQNGESWRVIQLAAKIVF